MSSDNGGTRRNMIGMARLSCLPCRRRKSKCDREEPCSSCVLRNTERFCYTAEVEEDVGNKATTSPLNRTIERGTSSPGDFKNGASTSRPSKRVKTEDYERGSKNKLNNTSPINIQSVTKTIEAMEEAIRCLKESAGIEDRVEKKWHSSLVQWTDIAHLMPPKEDCEMIIDYFFSDSQWQTSIIHSGVFRKHWSNLMKGQAIRSVIIAQMCGMIALTLALAPSFHPVSRLEMQPQHLSFCALSHEILEPPSVTLFQSSAPTIEDLQARDLLINYMSFTGYSDEAWQEVGKLIRRCKALQLYDEDKWDMRELSDWDVELRRKIATDVSCSDRWQSLSHQRIPDLPSTFRVQKPNHYSFDNYDVETGRLMASIPSMLSNSAFEKCKYMLSIGSDRVNSYLYNFLRWSPEERYQQAKEVDAYLDTLWIKELPIDLHYEVACKEKTFTDPVSARRASQSLIAYTSANRLRCTVMRQFLLDPKSPMDLRIAALEYARKVVETTPTIVTLSTNPWTSFSCSWVSGHLFLAASTFAIVYLGDGEQDLQDLNWFASKIFEVIEALSFLSAKDLLAKRCEELLTALCTSKDWLRERFLASRSGKPMIQNRKNSSHDNANDFSHREYLSKARQGTVPGMSTRIMNPDTYNNTASNGQSSMTIVSTVGVNNDSSPDSLWTSPPMTTTPNSIVPPIFEVSTSAKAIESLQNNVGHHGLSASQPWANWPLLNDQQWSHLLNTLEQDMISLSDNSNNNNTLL